MPRVEDVVEEALDALSRNCKDLWASGPIDVLDRPPSALEFARDYEKAEFLPFLVPEGAS